MTPTEELYKKIKIKILIMKKYFTAAILAVSNVKIRIY